MRNIELMWGDRWAVQGWLLVTSRGRQYGYSQGAQGRWAGCQVPDVWPQLYHRAACRHGACASTRHWLWLHGALSFQGLLCAGNWTTDTWLEKGGEKVNIQYASLKLVISRIKGHNITLSTCYAVLLSFWSYLVVPQSAGHAWRSTGLAGWIVCRAPREPLGRLPALVSWRMGEPCPPGVGSCFLLSAELGLHPGSSARISDVAECWNCSVSIIEKETPRHLHVMT